MEPNQIPNISSAVQDFYQARNKAMMKAIISRITGESIRLLSYDEVRKRLHAQNVAERGLKEIPLDAIVGSLGRYNDFTRDFLPLKDSIKERWTRVQVVATGLIGLPPIEVYQIGEVYFVKDGNHRVSVARQLGAVYIQAYVTEIKTRVPIEPADDPTEIIIKSELSAFLQTTRLDELRSGSNFMVSVPGKYEELEEHISVHRYFMGIDQNQEIPYQEAVTHWYGTIYLPVVKAIREQGILRYFPGRTDTDLYLWISNHRALLENEFGWQLKPETAVRLLVERFDRSFHSILDRLKERILGSISGGKLISGPPPGQWRKETTQVQADEHLFRDILVPIQSNQRGWSALEQAIIIAGKENAELHGLHIYAHDHNNSDRSMQEKFNSRCAHSGVKGDLVYAHGAISEVICDRARANDLVITSLHYPPGPLPIDRLESGFHEMIQKCPRPILAVPQMIAQFQRGLLAYDGSPKADEALYVSTYLAGRWKATIYVLYASNDKTKKTIVLNRASQYLRQHGVETKLISSSEDTGAAILHNSEKLGCDFVVMGGYGFTPILEIFVGSTVDQVLRKSKIPVLICR